MWAYMRSRGGIGRILPIRQVPWLLLVVLVQWGMISISSADDFALPPSLQMQESPFVV